MHQQATGGVGRSFGDRWAADYIYSACSCCGRTQHAPLAVPTAVAPLRLLLGLHGFGVAPPSRGAARVRGLLLSRPAPLLTASESVYAQRLRNASCQVGPRAGLSGPVVGGRGREVATEGRPPRWAEAAKVAGPRCSPLRQHKRASSGRQSRLALETHIHNQVRQEERPLSQLSRRVRPALLGPNCCCRSWPSHELPRGSTRRQRPQAVHPAMAAIAALEDDTLHVVLGALGPTARLVCRDWARVHDSAVDALSLVPAGGRRRGKAAGGQGGGGPQPPTARELGELVRAGGAWSWGGGGSRSTDNAKWKANRSAAV